MKIAIDTDTNSLTVDGTAHDLFSKEAFDVVAGLWVKTGWVRKYSYGFSWLGRPIIQLPDDMLRIQEAIWQVQPDVIVETGIAHGGSLIFYASLMEMIGKGRVIGLDIDIRAHNRAAIEAHPMIKRITMIEGSSTAPETVAAVKAHIGAGDTVMLILDSNHSRDHVADELAAYADLVTPGSYIPVAGRRDEAGRGQPARARRLGHRQPDHRRRGVPCQPRRFRAVAPAASLRRDARHPRMLASSGGLAATQELGCTSTQKIVRLEQIRVQRSYARVGRVRHRGDAHQRDVR